MFCICNLSVLPPARERWFVCNELSYSENRPLGQDTANRSAICLGCYLYVGESQSVSQPPLLFTQVEIKSATAPTLSRDGAHRITQP